MIQTKIYTTKTFYKNKFGEKEYLTNTESDNWVIKAAILTGKGVESEEELIYASYGETIEESEKSMDNYIKTMTDLLPIITRRETINLVSV